MTVYERVEAMLTKAFGVEPKAVSREATFDEMDLDSLAQVEFSEVLSERFGFELDAEKFITLENLGELIDLIEARVASV
ncbi:acyl carrier protein [Amycolatopsis decaplanina]|uniref:Putative acyl carrier protein n=1 Tax=Amycolatopsis decaplanina DSM 44594 TaxID=1284240 RepID=M2Z2U9_9PSEU|nr:acyl carrier protein [Amycolatopsis decaplanina]EME54944.1 putative acyl carrier protein [Amycolatopsis decaplanina DSM 44594]